HAARAGKTGPRGARQAQETAHTPGAQPVLTLGQPFAAGVLFRNMLDFRHPDIRPFPLPMAAGSPFAT
ncbi:MAG: hypothetical protein K2N07_05815, partial [Desulfovibrio sp.]|nr:hypothetical protein [Desulfovibrio sp.]